MASIVGHSQGQHSIHCRTIEANSNPAFFVSHRLRPMRSPFFTWIKNSHMMEYLKSRIHTFSTFFHLTKSHTCTTLTHGSHCTHTRHIIQWLHFTCLLCCIRHRSAEVDWIQVNCVGFLYFLFVFLSFKLFVTDYIVWHFMEQHLSDGIVAILVSLNL